MFGMSPPGGRAMNLILMSMMVLAGQTPEQQKLDEAEKRAHDIDTLKKAGAVLIYEESLPKRPLVRMELNGPQVTDEVMPLLRQFVELQSLQLGRTRVNDKGLESLRGLKS